MPSEIEASPNDERPLARQLVVVVQWVQFVVLVVQIKETEGDVAVVSAETITDIGVQLEDVVARDIRRVADVTLGRPVRFRPREKSRGMIVEREDLRLMKGGFFHVIRAGNNSGRDVGESRLQA